MKNEMTEKDIIFKKIAPGEEVDSNCFCHYGWEGIGSFAFWKYATAYYDSAEILFDKFKDSAGHYAILDGTGITMCFLYRHFVELSIKYLNVKFVCTSEADYKALLEKNHNLYELWSITKPKLSELKKRVGSSVNLGVLEHYVLEFDRFDKDSMTMRYPVKKDLSPMNEATRLDIYNLHDRMSELYNALEAIAYDLDNQLRSDVDPVRIDAFLAEYEDLRPRVMWLVDAMKPFAEKENQEFKITDFVKGLSGVKDGMDQMGLLLSCPDDELIMFDTLYYTGRAIASEELRLPKNPHEAKIDAVKMCVKNMDRDSLEFGKPKNDEICIHQKMASSIIKYVSRAVEVIDWDK